MPAADASTLEGLVAFWRDAGPHRWFAKDAAFDADFRTRFLTAHEAAARGELGFLADAAARALGLVVLLDQFPRNAFRGEARMYASDALARAEAGRAIERGFDRTLDEADAPLRLFFYLPFMHSEDLADHARSLELFAAIGGEPLRFARHHHDIVARFGRFPHRNAVLGRPSTAEEKDFLAAGGFAG
jgi:uncharacterized protein (DUF924 family)